MLNDGGGIEADLTVTRLAEDRFRIVTGTAFARHDMSWIARHLPADGATVVEDVTGQHACFCLWGPQAREILQPLSDDDLSHAAFPFLRARAISVGTIPVFAQRITFVGELGWELYCPAEFGLALWDLLWNAGREHGMLGGGYRAIDSLRLEKGLRVWGLDITPETTPLEAGLGFAVRMDKPGGFIGQEALARQREEGTATRLRCIVLDDPRAVCLGNEPVRIGGTPVGRVTSGGFGHRVERSIAYAYLPASASPGDRVEIGVFGRWVGAEVAREPLYDPANDRVKGVTAAPG
jgi:4-methylaminobutanoate oxidase (formaldehyde-forming)